MRLNSHQNLIQAKNHKVDSYFIKVGPFSKKAKSFQWHLHRIKGPSIFGWIILLISKSNVIIWAELNSTGPLEGLAHQWCAQFTSQSLWTGNKRVMELLHTFVKGLNMKAYFTKTTSNKANMIYTCPTRTFLKGIQAKMESVFPGHTSAYEYNHKRHNFSSDVIFLENFHGSPP